MTERVTFDGDYNARPRMLPDGKHLVFVHRRQGIFHIALLDMERDRLMVLTKTSLDESPSLAPNGTMLIYATQDRGRGILAVVSIDGAREVSIAIVGGRCQRTCVVALSHFDRSGTMTRTSNLNGQENKMHKQWLRNALAIGVFAVLVGCAGSSTQEPEPEPLPPDETPAVTEPAPEPEPISRSGRRGRQSR